VNEQKRKGIMGIFELWLFSLSVINMYYIFILMRHMIMKKTSAQKSPGTAPLRGLGHQICMFIN
jgi:hypothetical protein